MKTNALHAQLRYLYRKNPLAFPRDMLGVTLSEQQEPLFLEMIESNARTVVKSATGTGKTFLLAVVILHQLFTEDNVNIVATSPSAGQLQRGLRKELGKVHSLIKEDTVADLFELQRDAIFLRDTKESHICFLVTGSAENEENLAGVHADKVLIIIDEASGFSKEVMGILDGNLTTEGSSMIQTSNPQRPSGPFFELFNNPIEGYNLHTLDAYNSPNISKKWIKQMIDKWGEDSDFVRVRILGEFPRTSDSLFIPNDIIDEAVKRNLHHRDYKNLPIYLGVDVARFGSDKSVLVLKQGYKVLDIQTFAGIDTMELASQVQEYYYRNPKIASVTIDSVGVGAGVCDRLKQLDIPITEINVGAASSNNRAYYNLRAEVYSLMKDWLRSADIPDNEDFIRELRSIMYGFNSKSQLQIMTKADMKKLGSDSPDIVDALTFCFYHTTLTSIRHSVKARGVKRSRRWLT